MQIACPNCSTAYDLAPAALGANGRSVRCVRCRTVWLAKAVAEPAVTPVAAPGADRPVAARPATEDAELTEQGTPSGEFDWSIDQSGVEADTAPAARERAAGAAAGQSLGQGGVDLLWSSVERASIEQTQ